MIAIKCCIDYWIDYHILIIQFCDDIPLGVMPKCYIVTSLLTCIIWCVEALSCPFAHPWPYEPPHGLDALAMLGEHPPPCPSWAMTIRHQGWQFCCLWDLCSFLNFGSLGCFTNLIQIGEAMVLLKWKLKPKICKIIPKERCACFVWLTYTTVHPLKTWWKIDPYHASYTTSTLGTQENHDHIIAWAHEMPNVAMSWTYIVYISTNIFEQDHHL